MESIPRISLREPKKIKEELEDEDLEDLSDGELFARREYMPNFKHEDKKYQSAKIMDDQILYISDPEKMLQVKEYRKKVRKINISKLKPLK